MIESPLEKLDSREYIVIEGARMHNLKNVSVAIPRNKLVVITGLSGSGKSSLAFDTLYAEGQRRYVESLSSYARQFLGRLDKPDVDTIRGISPAISIEQRVTSRSSRSTVGTSTEIYDYLKLLFARVGVTYSPISGNPVKKHTVSDVVNELNKWDKGIKYLVLAPLRSKSDRTIQQQIEMLMQQGFARVMLNDKMLKIDEALTAEISTSDKIEIVVDRLSISHDESHDQRLADSVQTAFFESNGDCWIRNADDNSTLAFNNRFELDGIHFEEPTPNFFSFNNPVGACKRCEGFGKVIGIDEDLVIPDKSLSVYNDCIACWKGEKLSAWKDKLILHAGKFDFPIHKPFIELAQEQQRLLWTGNAYFEGLNTFFSYLEEKSYKIQYRVMLSRYRGRTTCPECKGSRLRKDSHYVKIDGHSIMDLVNIPVEEILTICNGISLSKTDQIIADRLLVEIRSRLGFLCDVGLGYLTLNRLSNTLSGGESQRINLSTCLGSSLVGSMYILDEPSIGLHPRDTHRLIKVLKTLRDLGNTVIVVEHDEEIMEAADQIIDIGPDAGIHGGQIVFQGPLSELTLANNSWTAAYLIGDEEIPIPVKKPISKDKLIVKGARENNLKNINVEFPLRSLVAVTGVSGSGKSTLVRDILYPSVRRELGEYGDQMGQFDSLSGDIKSIKAVEFVDQNPIGKSSRSNPVTYVKAFDEIRAIYAGLHLSKSRGLKPSHFSFNVSGGRCDNCEGEGQVTIEMQFMADIKLECDVCKGKRFKEEILEIEYLGKNINDILNLTVEEAIGFFQEDKSTTNNRLVKKLQPLVDVGLGYVGLGQSSSTLSGGEAQRIKLASFLSKGDRQTHTLFIFDEPTTGLHFHDVKKLLDAFYALLGQGHSIIVIEHHPDIIKCSDWVIDLGPEGGLGGGSLLFSGRPDELSQVKKSYTGKYLKHKIHTLK
jgi:excinuclease ABC subunit A